MSLLDGAGRQGPTPHALKRLRVHDRAMRNLFQQGRSWRDATMRHLRVVRELSRPVR